MFHQQRVFQLQDPLHPEHLSEISPPELAEKPALFNEFMQADRLDIVSQDTGSKVSKAYSDQVSKDIKERRENWHYFHDLNPSSIPLLGELCQRHGCCG